MKKSISFPFIFFWCINFVAGQDFGKEYSGFKVYKNLTKALKKESEVVVLDLSKKNITSLPETICQLTNLRVLNLSGNRIANLPECLFALKGLEILIVSENELKRLPNQIFKLKNLKRLYASRNYIGVIPEEIVELRKLEILDLSFNDLIDSDADFVRKALPGCFVLVYLKL